jgi:peptidylprolyl isomerase
VRLAAALAALAVSLASAQALAAAPPAPSAPDWRKLDPETVLQIDTNKGRILVELIPEAAPAHVAQIKALARMGFYDGLTFFRVIDQFMAQTGDPKNTGEGDSNFPNLAAEFSWRRGASDPFATAARPMGLQLGFLKSLPVVSQPDSMMAASPDMKVSAWATYCPGVAGMARNSDPDSANSQFFLMRQAYPTLDKRYTVWGRVVSGLDVVRAIKTGEPVQDPDRMLKVRVLADVPESQRPSVYMMDVTGPAFGKLLESVRKDRGADFSICDVDLPVQIR